MWTNLTAKFQLTKSPFVFQELCNEADSEGWEEAPLMHRLSAQVQRQQEISAQVNKWKLPPTGQPICLFSPSETASTLIKPKDDSEYNFYNMMSRFAKQKSEYPFIVHLLTKTHQDL